MIASKKLRANTVLAGLNTRRGANGEGRLDSG
jgi:hypothetical protein